MKNIACFSMLLTSLAAGGFVFLRSQGVPEIAAGEISDDVPPPVAAADDWPCWRGKRGDGIANSSLPLSWSDSTGILWKTPTPGQGHASPLVCGQRVFLSAADESSGERVLLCYELQSGKLLWSTPFHPGGFMAKHDKNSHASPTPACDGSHVFIPFVADGALWLTAIDVDGRVAWETKVGPFVSEWGYASSPALYTNLVIVAGENRGSRLGHVAGTTSYLAAIHRRTGEIIWRVRRPRAFSYGTPVLAEVAGRTQLLLGGTERISSYDPATGQELWYCRWSARRTANSMAFSDTCVFASATFSDPQIVCIRADGSGDVTNTHVLWRQQKGASDVPSPLSHDGLLYVVNEKGIANCFDAADGKILWSKRLAAGFSASPILSDDRIYITAEDGITHVFKTGRVFEMLAANALSDQVLASPAVAGNRLLIRGSRFLWCLRP